MKEGGHADQARYIIHVLTEPSERVFVVNFFPVSLIETSI